MNTHVKNIGHYRTLVVQLDKLARHNRQGSYRTKDRYYEAMKRFCRFLADEYHLQKLSNINGKHLTSYVEYLQDTGKAASTIKTDLAAIRFFHDKMGDAKYRLPSNGELAVTLERRRFGEVDRTWSDIEFNKMVNTAFIEGHDDYCCAFYLARFAGLRIHEVFRLDTAAAERALHDKAITVKGKGGKVRTGPIEDERISAGLRQVLKETERGHKLFVPDGVPTDRAINALQLFIIKHRDAAADESRETNLVFHGLRHTFAAEKYKMLIDGGMSELDAHFTVSRLLGHERADVTNIYLASVEKVKAKTSEDEHGE